MADATPPKNPTTLALRRREVVLIVPVALPAAGGEPTVPWTAGPLPLTVPSRAETVTDAAWRSRELAPAVCSALHAPGRRSHRLVENVRLPGTELDVFAIELQRIWDLRETGTSALLIVHARAESDGRKFIADLKHAARDLDAPAAEPVTGCYARLLEGGPGSGGVVTPGTRQAMSLALVTEVAPTVTPQPGPGDWATGDQWRWALAHASPPTDRALKRPQPPPTPGATFAAPDRVFTVLPHGVSVVGTRPDTDASGSRDFDFHVVGTHTVYTDVLAFGVIQQLVLDQLATELGALEDPVVEATALRRIQRDLRVFRTRYWWTRTSAWAWPDRLLAALAEQRGTRELMDSVTQSISDSSEEASMVRTQRTNELLGLVGLLGLPAVAAGVLQATGASPAQAGSIIAVVGLVVLVPGAWLIVRLVSSFRRRRDSPRL